MTLKEFACKKNLTPEQVEELKEHIGIVADAMADYIINNNFFNNDKQHPELCQEQASK
jgi:hypothetical protein